MRNEQLIAGLDIGSNKTRLAIGKLEEKENGSKQLNIIAVSEVPTEGFNKGDISNLEDLVSTISSVVEKAEMKVGASIDEVCVGVAGDHIVSKIVKGSIVISKANNEIDIDDIDRLIETVKSTGVPTNYDILHIMPISFNVDGQLPVKNPIGMTGMRIEADVEMITGLSTRINNFKHAINRTQLDSLFFVFSPLAAAEAVLTKRQKDMGVLVLDLGHSITKGVIFEEGSVIHTFNFPIGAFHITADLAIGLKTSIETAEKIKRKEGTLNISSIRRTEQVDISKYENKKEIGKKNNFSKRYINEIIEARVDEIFSFVAQELKKAKRFGKLPAGVVLTGGGAEMPYLVDYVKEKLLLPVSIGYPTGFIANEEKVFRPEYATVSGLLLWSIMQQEERKTKKIKIDFSKFFFIIKKWFKILTP